VKWENRQKRKKENRLTWNRPKGLWLILLDLSTDSILLVKRAGWLVQKIAERGWVEEWTWFVSGYMSTRVRLKGEATPPAYS
jgi:hypothetical protein